MRPAATPRVQSSALVGCLSVVMMVGIIGGIIGAVGWAIKAMRTPRTQQTIEKAPQTPAAAPRLAETFDPVKSFQAYADRYGNHLKEELKGFEVYWAVRDVTKSSSLITPYEAEMTFEFVTSDHRSAQMRRRFGLKHGNFWGPIEPTTLEPGVDKSWEALAIMANLASVSLPPAPNSK